LSTLTTAVELFLVLVKKHNCHSQSAFFGSNDRG